MKSIIISGLVILGSLIYSADISLSFKPFKFKIGSYKSPIAAICLGIGFVLMGSNARDSGYKEGIKDMAKEAEEILAKQFKQGLSSNHVSTVNLIWSSRLNEDDKLYLVEELRELHQHKMQRLDSLEKSNK